MLKANHDNTITFKFPEPADMLNRYQYAVKISMPLVERWFGKPLNAKIRYVSDAQHHYSYVSYQEREITYNTDSYELTYGGSACYHILRMISEYGVGYTNDIVTNTLIYDNVIHEMVHLMIETEPEKYFKDEGFRQTIESLVKYHTLNIIEQNFNKIDDVLDTTILKLIWENHLIYKLTPITKITYVRPFNFH